MKTYYERRVRNLINNLSINDTLEYTTYLVEELTSALEELEKIRIQELRKEMAK